MRNAICAVEPASRLASIPPTQDPSANPAMKTESTMDTIGVVTPNLAIASRNQITSYTRLQKPEIRKNAKYHCLFIEVRRNAGQTLYRRFLRGAGRSVLSVHVVTPVAGSSEKKNQTLLSNSAVLIRLSNEEGLTGARGRSSLSSTSSRRYCAVHNI